MSSAGRTASGEAAGGGGDVGVGLVLEPLGDGSMDDGALEAVAWRQQRPANEIVDETDVTAAEVRATA